MCVYYQWDMGARETASRQNHQPLPAHLDVSAGTDSGPLEKHTRTTPGETRFSISCALPSLPRPAVDYDDSVSLLTLPPRPKSCQRKQPLKQAARNYPFEIKAPSGTKNAASVPLTVKPFAINGSSGPTAWTPFFVKKSKGAASRAVADGDNGYT